jgi:hypothetical protein
LTVTNPISALLYLRFTSLRNALASRLRRLKQPKYLAGGVIGVAYLYFFFGRRMAARPSANIAMLALIRDDLLPVAATVCALLLLLFVLLCWVWPRERAALRFTEAEIAFLFPAPLRRRTLIHYQLLSAQGRIFFTAVVMSLFSSGWSFLLGNAAIRILGWWIIVATLSLHIIASSFVVTKLLDSGVTTRRRQIFTIGMVGLVVGGLLAWTSHDLRAPDSDDLAGLDSFARYLAATLNSGPLPWLLLPTKAVVQPLLSPDPYSFLLALGPALLVYGVHYLWVLKSEVAFEEASIAKAEKRAVKVAALRQGRYRLGRATPKARRAPFNLGATRRVEFAFLWKNLLSTATYLRPRTAIIATLIIVAASRLGSGNPIYEGMRPGIAIFALIIGAYLIVLGPQIARQDLRSDLTNADILKTYPLRGWQVILGEILTPLAIVTVLVWLALLAFTLTAQTERFAWLTSSLLTTIAIGAALVVPLLCSLQLIVLNTAAVSFPAWLQTARQTGGGIDVFGQRLLFLAGNTIVVVLALVPATLVGGTLFFTAQWIVGDVLATALGATAILAVLGAEAWLGIRWLGARFERFDLSAELRS